MDKQTSWYVLMKSYFHCPCLSDASDNFSTLCVVRADLSPLESSAEPKAGTAGKTYWTIVFSVEIQFGLTEFKARIKWVDNVRFYHSDASSSLKIFCYYRV